MSLGLGVKFPIFQKLKKVQIAGGRGRGMGGWSRKLWTFSTFCYIFSLGLFPKHKSLLHRGTSSLAGMVPFIPNAMLIVFIQKLLLEFGQIWQYKFELNAY